MGWFLYDRDLPHEIVKSEESVSVVFKSLPKKGEGGVIRINCALVTKKTLKDRTTYYAEIVCLSEPKYEEQVLKRPYVT